MGEAADAEQGGHWQNPRVTGRILEVDGLRGIAILLVLFFHYVTAVGAPRYPIWGFVTASTRLFWSGVDLFFILSGLLIAGILIDSVESPNYFKTFYLRRIHRIFPLYFIWLGLFYLGVYLEPDGPIEDSLFHATAPLWFYPLFIQNNAPLWLNATLPVWMRMSWSLAVEEQFYIVLPSIVRFVSSEALKWACAAAILLSPIYRFALVVHYPNINEGWPFATLCRLDGLAMGVLIAILIRRKNWWSWMTQHSAVIRACGVSMFLGFVALTYFPPAQAQMALYGFTLVVVFYALVLLLALTQPQSRLAWALRSPLLRYFGKIAYAIYIFHQGVHGLLAKIVPTWGPRLNALRVVAVVVLSVFVTLILAELSWRLMESKLIRRAHLRYKY